MGMRNYFDWVPVINLDKRRRKMADFNKRVAAIPDWPFLQPERFPGVDGAALGHPNWFSAGGPAWGCAQSHMRILETAIIRGYDRILVLEDDAVFIDDFADKSVKFIRALPRDWHQAYLGGQHLKREVRAPKPVNTLVSRAFNVNRLHGYALNKPFFNHLYLWLTNFTMWSNVKAVTHIDHMMGLLHETGRYNIYAARKWLIGQGSGLSDINHKTNPVRYWDEPVTAAANK